jgi:hypothetical protein
LTSTVKRKLRTVVLTNFKTLEDCIECGELKDLEEFNLPDEDELEGLSPDDDPGGIKQGRLLMLRLNAK